MHIRGSAGTGGPATAVCRTAWNSRLHRPATGRTGATGATGDACRDGGADDHEPLTGAGAAPPTVVFEAPQVP